MKRKLTPLVALVFFGVTGFAQSLSGIKGNVKDDISRKDIEGVSIAIVKVNDSSLVKATSTNREGNFSIENISKGSYRILFAYLGYRKSYSPVINVKGVTIDIGTVFLTNEARSLMEVTVVSRKPIIERKIDKTVINIDGSILNAGGTAMDILEASPGISVDKDGNISLKGKSGVNIMIDGKPAYLSGQQLTDWLKSMPASGLDQLEIMTNPSAKYDASGNSGIINIKTKKNKTKGFNGNAGTSYGQNIAFINSNNISLNYRNNSLNIFGSYSVADRTEYRDLNILRKFWDSSGDVIENIFDQESFLKKRSANQNAKLGVDFYAAGNTILGLVFTGNFAATKSTDNNTSLIQDPLGRTDSSLNAISMIRGRFKQTGINLNLRHRFDSIGKELTADIDYIDFKQADVQLFDNKYFNADRSVRKLANKLRGSLPADVRVYSGKVDYSHPLRKGARLETGIKWSYVETDNSALYHNLKSSSWEPDYGKTNHFRYNERINAAYINYNRQLKKWGLQAGLRVENTIASGHQLGNQANRDSAFKRSYTGIFPTVFVSYYANLANTFSANIGRRIGRPEYQALNPFYYFLDDYTYRVGNTQLKPQYTNSIEVSHVYKGVLTTTMNYSKTKDLFSEVFKQVTSERKFIITHENIASREEIGIAVGATIPFSKTWSSNVFTNLSNSKFNGTINGSSFEVSGTVLSGNVSNQFKFKNGWAAELNGWFRSRGVDGQVISDPMWAVSTGVQKEIIKKKGALKLGIRDIFNSQKFSGIIRHEELDAKIVNNNFQRTATLTFTYRFGKTLNPKQERNAGSAADEQNRIKKG
jgi:hypothetical protein